MNGLPSEESMLSGDLSRIVRNSEEVVFGSFAKTPEMPSSKEPTIVASPKMNSSSLPAAQSDTSNTRSKLVFLGNGEESDIEVSAPHDQSESDGLEQGFENSSIVSFRGCKEFAGSRE